MVKSGRSIYAFLFPIVILFACKKTEHFIEHKDTYVDGVNKIPPYNGVTTLAINNYVNKLNIDLLGVEPEKTTLDNDAVYLKKNELSRQSRIDVVDKLLALPNYYDRLFQVASSLMLNGMDRTEIGAIRDEQQFIRDYLYLTGDTIFGQVIEQEVNKLNDLLASQTAYEQGEINIGEFYARFCYNTIYDQINMGSANFVISCFENLLKRYPTDEELANGVKMVDGQSSIVLLQGGKGKIDFINIVVNSADFHAGRIIDAFQSMLLRSPESDEMAALLAPFFKTGKYEAMLTEIIVTDEYAGF